SGITQLAQLSLQISNPDVSLPFYTEKLGMTLLAERADGNETRYFLGFVQPGHQMTKHDFDPSAWQTRSYLELVHKRHDPELDVRKQPDVNEGYWKIALSVSELDIAHARLIKNGVEVDSPRQVGDIAYLCHFSDPDGYCIELIQHDFLQNHQSIPEDVSYALGSRPTFSLITYRVKDVEASLRFYTEFLGLRLLSVQPVPTREFTLYFLACTEEAPPHVNLEHVGNREWLWQRPYTIVELQHIWGTEKRNDFAYRTGAESGFESISFATRDLSALQDLAAQQNMTISVVESDSTLRATTATVVDPDGYSVRLIDKAAESRKQ
ncbi:MAG: hypothetical protein HOM16_04905, partial [Woeseia sp.]|nr:hypothetical protein [Woeseia sp.]